MEHPINGSNGDAGKFRNFAHSHGGSITQNVKLRKNTSGKIGLSLLLPQHEKPEFFTTKVIEQGKWFFPQT
jgi:hypothetical protein